jgi:hypothetical protein
MTTRVQVGYNKLNLWHAMADSKIGRAVRCLREMNLEWLFCFPDYPTTPFTFVSVTLTICDEPKLDAYMSPSVMPC